MPKRRRLFSTRGQATLFSNDYKSHQQGKMIPLERKSTSDLRNDKNPMKSKKCPSQRRDLKSKLSNHDNIPIPLKSCLSSQRQNEKIKMKVKFYIKKGDDSFRCQPTHTSSAHDVNKNIRKRTEFVTTHQKGAQLNNNEIGLYRRGMAGDSDIKLKQHYEKTETNNLNKSLAGKIKNMIVEKSKQLSDTSIRLRHVRKAIKIRSFNSCSSINYDKFKERLNKRDKKYQTLSHNLTTKNVSTANNSLNEKYKLARINNVRHPRLCDKLEVTKQNRQIPNKLSKHSEKIYSNATHNNYDKGNSPNIQNRQRENYENKETNLSAVVYQDICITGRKLKLWKSHSKTKRRRVLSIGIGRESSSNNIKYYSDNQSTKNIKSTFSEVNTSKVKENRHLADSKLKKEHKFKSEQVYQTEVFRELCKAHTNLCSKKDSSTIIGQSSIDDIPKKSEVRCKSTVLNLKKYRNNNVICPERDTCKKKIQKKKSIEPQLWNDLLESSIRQKHIENVFLKKSRHKVIPMIMKELTDQFSSLAKTETNTHNMEKRGKYIRNQICAPSNDKLHSALPTTRLNNDGKPEGGHRKSQNSITEKQLSKDKEQKRGVFLKEVNGSKSSLTKLWSNVLSKLSFSFKIKKNSHLEKHPKVKEFRKNMSETPKQINSPDKSFPLIHNRLLKVSLRKPLRKDHSTDKLGKSAAFNKCNFNSQERTHIIDEQRSKKNIDNELFKEITKNKNKTTNDKLNQSLMKKLSVGLTKTANIIKTEENETITHTIFEQQSNKHQHYKKTKKKQQNATTTGELLNAAMKRRLSKNLTGAHNKNNNQPSDHSINLLVNEKLTKKKKKQENIKSTNDRKNKLLHKLSKAAEKLEKNSDSQIIPREIDKLLSDLLMNQTPHSGLSELPDTNLKHHEIPAYPNKARKDLHLKNDEVLSINRDDSNKSRSQNFFCRNCWTKCKEKFKCTQDQQISMGTSLKPKHLKSIVSETNISNPNKTKIKHVRDNLCENKITKLNDKAKPKKKRSITEKKDSEMEYVSSKNNRSLDETKHILQNQNNITRDSLHKQYTERLFFNESHLNDIKQQITDECKRSLFECNSLEKQRGEIEYPSPSNQNLNNNEQTKFFEAPKSSKHSYCDEQSFKTHPLNMNVCRSTKTDERYTEPEFNTVKREDSNIKSTELILPCDYEQSYIYPRLISKQSSKSTCQEQYSKSDSVLEQHRARKLLNNQYCNKSKQSIGTQCKKTQSESLKTCPESESMFNQRTERRHVHNHQTDYLCFNVHGNVHEFSGRQKTKSPVNRPFTNKNRIKNSFKKEVSECVCGNYQPTIGTGTSKSRLEENKQNDCYGCTKRLSKSTTSQRDKKISFKKEVSECVCGIYQRTIGTGTSNSRLKENKQNVCNRCKKRLSKSTIKSAAKDKTPIRDKCLGCLQPNKTFKERFWEYKKTLKQKICLCTCYFKHCDDKCVLEKKLREGKVIPKQPYVFLYKIFPRAYPHFLHFIAFAKHGWRIGMLSLAVMSWIPWIFFGIITVLIFKYIIFS